MTKEQFNNLAVGDWCIMIRLDEYPDDFEGGSNMWEVLRKEKGSGFVLKNDVGATRMLHNSCFDLWDIVPKIVDLI